MSMFKSYIKLVIAVLCVVFALPWVAQAQPLVDVLILPHQTSDGHNLQLIIASHPNGKLACLNFAMSNEEQRANTIAADYELLLDILGVYDQSKQTFSKENMELASRALDIAFKKEWTSLYSGSLIKKLTMSGEDEFTLGAVKIRTTVVNDAKLAELQRKKSVIYPYLNTQKMNDSANPDRVDPDIFIRFLIDEYGYEGVEFKRIAWALGKVDTVFILPNSEAATQAGVLSHQTQKRLIYIFASLLLILIVMLSFLTTRFLQFKRNVSLTLNQTSRQLKQMDEHCINGNNESMNVLSMAQHLIQLKEKGRSKDDELLRRLQQRF